MEKVKMNTIRRRKELMKYLKERREKRMRLRKPVYGMLFGRLFGKAVEMSMAKRLKKLDMIRSDAILINRGVRNYQYKEGEVFSVVVTPVPPIKAGEIKRTHRITKATQVDYIIKKPGYYETIVIPAELPDNVKTEILDAAEKRCILAVCEDGGDY